MIEGPSSRRDHRARLLYVAVALAWLWGVDGVRPSTWDVAGVAVGLAGMALIAFQPRAAWPQQFAGLAMRESRRLRSFKMVHLGRPADALV